MNQVYATSDICLVPLRRSELFTAVLPSKLFEIMAMERPIVLAVDGEARRLVEDAGAGIYVEPENVEQFVQAIERLADAPLERLEMGRRGRAFAIENYDRARLAGNYLDILERVVSARSRVPR